MPRRHLFLYLDKSELATLQNFMTRMAIKGKRRARLHGNAILLSHQKRSIPEIAYTLGKSENSIRTWLKLYREKGINGIAPFKYPTKLSDEQIKELMSVSHYSALGKDNKAYHNRWSLRRMAKWVEEKWNIRISYESIRQIVQKKIRGIN
jgi:transposase